MNEEQPLNLKYTISDMVRSIGQTIVTENGVVSTGRWALEYDQDEKETAALLKVHVQVPTVPTTGDGPMVDFAAYTDRSGAQELRDWLDAVIQKMAGGDGDDQ